MTFDDRQPTNPISEELAKFSARTFRADQLKRFDPPEWLIDGVLMQSSQAFLWGIPKSGKSFVALDWALSIAMDRTWFSRKTVAGNSLYIFGEGALGAIGQRISAWESHRGCEVVGENFLAVAKPVKMLEEYAEEIVTQIVKEQEGATGMPTRLIVIDTLARAVVGHNENDMAEMGKLIEVADAVKENTKATVLFVHHSSTGARMRGSTALGGGLDTEIEMVYDVNTKSRQLHCCAQKDAKGFEDIPVFFRELSGSVVPTPNDPNTF